jgi:lipopolysaccharide cholinephosphotransferase
MNLNNTRRLQMVILQIMKDIDSLCKINNIEYYLIGGSALGAVRHKGFIPWDDDLDIAMTASNYEKFITVCREQLSTEKYFFQEGLVDWPLNFSKVKLKGTSINEIEMSESECNGIFLDIFKLENVPNDKISQAWQYFCAKVWLCYLLNKRTYKSASGKKKIMIYLSNILSIGCLEDFFKRQVNRHNNTTTNYLGFYFSRTNWNNSIFRKDIYGKPTLMEFEGIKLPVPEKVENYLTILFGNYMKLPPEKDRVGLHAIEVDFGKY